MIDSGRLLADTKRQVVALIDDLRAVAAIDPNASAHVTTEYERARAAGRTAFGQAEWAEGLYAQVAVAWVLACVFVRFCEDNGLIDDPLLGGPGIRSQIALDHRATHLRANPAHDDRQWLREVFGRIRALPATGDIFGGHNPVWVDGLVPSADGARKLREELTRLDPETGELRHDFTDPTWNTRFLGDLYQDLSEHAKRAYALLQTPMFVEEFILDRTLEPAIATFGLADTTIIDPTCGSGHFLLDAFARLFDRWLNLEPTTNRRELARRALDAIGGIDLNPFAASIARSRLLLAALRAGGDQRLVDAPAYEINIAVGDSLLHGDPPGSLPGLYAPGEEEELVANHGYEAEDVAQVRGLLGRSWAAVVGNPPYITVKDSALNAAYRARFSSCHRQYSLAVPFMERFWQLARVDDDSERVGFVGLITANSFMKREFGKRLVEEWIPRHEISQLVDTKGAFIPGHGTPTVILFGRNRAPRAATVLATLGIRNEPSRPSDPSRGRVWSSIARLSETPGSSDEFVQVVRMDRARLQKHPMSIGGRGAAELKETLDRRGRRLSSAVVAISGISYTRLDDAYFAPRGSWRRHGVPDHEVVPVVTGEDVRDWVVSLDVESLFPYDADLNASGSAALLRALWPAKAMLKMRKELGGLQEEIGLTWFEWNRFLKHHYRNPRSVTFANVSPTNHFVFVEGRVVFNAHAPVIKLSEDAPRSAYMRILAILNSSVAGFWLQQVCQNKGRPGANAAGADEPYELRFELDVTKLKELPLADADASGAERLSGLAVELSAARPRFRSGGAVPTAALIKELDGRYHEIRRQLVAAQERLDWNCYASYGLLAPPGPSAPMEPPLDLGERAFEIVLARRMAGQEVESSWFERHGSKPITDLPSHWSPEYRQLVQHRIQLIETDESIGLLERPEYKRRWLARPWEEQVKAGLHLWLLDRLESDRYWGEIASITTVARLTAEARADDEFVSVVRLIAGRDDVDLAAVVAQLVKETSVAYISAYRYSDSGLRKHGEWLRTWESQRRVERGEPLGAIPIPPRYAKPDFNDAGWDLRGALDVAKERFISYTGAERETDASMVIGWAGWSHLDRARALAGWYLQARRDGRDAAHLTPLLAGLAELVPWLKHWYDEPNPDPSLDRPGTQIAALLDTEMRALGVTTLDLSAWRPEKKRSGRPRKAAT